jgi:tetratricopeptide (TPR) repeat protein
MDTEKAIELDPEYARAYTMLEFTYFIDTRYGWYRPREEYFQKMVESAQRAVKVDESDPDVHVLLGNIHLWRREHDQAILEGERSIALGPNNAENHAIPEYPLFC